MTESTYGQVGSDLNTGERCSFPVSHAQTALFLFDVITIIIINK